MGSNLLQMAQQFMSGIIQKNAVNGLADVPWRQAAIDAIISGDQAKGQELANNIIQSYGFSSPEEAVQQGVQNLTNK